MKIPQLLPKNVIWRFMRFSLFLVVKVSRSVYCLWKSVERLMSYFCSIFLGKFAGGSPRMNFFAVG
jgi:hypothetical protein